MSKEVEDAWIEWCLLPSDVELPDSLRVALDYWSMDNWEYQYTSNIGVVFFKQVNTELPRPRTSDHGSKMVQVLTAWFNERLDRGRNKLVVGIIRSRE